MPIDVKTLKRVGKGTPPPPTETTDNLQKPAPGALVPLQVNVEPEIRRQFKLYAVERDTDMSKLFVTMWQFYKQNHG